MANPSYRRSAERESLLIVPQTCPQVDFALAAVEEAVKAAVDAAAADIKHETEALREALVTAIQERDEAQDQLSAARDELESAGAEIDSLKTEIASLKAEVGGLAGELAALERM